MTRNERKDKADQILNGRSLGELTKDERREVLKLIVSNIKDEIESPEFRRALAVNE